MVQQTLVLLLLPVIIFLSTRCHACKSHTHSETPAFDSPTYAPSITYPHEARQQTSDSSSLSPGIIAAIAIASAVVVVALVFLFLCLSKRFAKPETANKEYQGFADWRQDRNLTSVEISRTAGAQPSQNHANGLPTKTNVK